MIADYKRRSDRDQKLIEPNCVDVHCKFTIDISIDIIYK